MKKEKKNASFRRQFPFLHKIIAVCYISIALPHFKNVHHNFEKKQNDMQSIEKWQLKM